jgi:uncharacterized protein YbaR (Trm112 family)
MKRELLEILACPVCKSSPLIMTVDKEDGSEIVEGELACQKCGRKYPIEGSIPNMLPHD